MRKTRKVGGGGGSEIRKWGVLAKLESWKWGVGNVIESAGGGERKKSEAEVGGPQFFPDLPPPHLIKWNSPKWFGPSFALFWFIHQDCVFPFFFAPDHDKTNIFLIHCGLKIHFKLRCCPCPFYGVGKMVFLVLVGLNAIWHHRSWAILVAEEMYLKMVSVKCWLFFFRLQCVNRLNITSLLTDFCPLQENDPFEEDPNAEVHVGTVKIWLQSLAYHIDMEEQLQITDYRGSEVGLMNIAIMPCNKKGKEYSEKDDVWVDDPAELVGRDLFFNFKIDSARGLPAKFTVSLWLR